MQILRARLYEHPIDVLLFSVRHKYTGMMNESAEATLDIPPYTMLSCVPPNVFAAWVCQLCIFSDIISSTMYDVGRID